VEADLLGLPLRLIVSQKTLAQQSVEYKFRKTGETGIVRIDEVVKFSLEVGR
jgi:prolyl-tRNA synthetase